VTVTSGLGPGGQNGTGFKLESRTSPASESESQVAGVVTDQALGLSSLQSQADEPACEPGPRSARRRRRPQRPKAAGAAFKVAARAGRSAWRRQWSGRADKVRIGLDGRPPREDGGRPCHGPSPSPGPATRSLSESPVAAAGRPTS
jgi:hypothetical protein